MDFSSSEISFMIFERVVRDDIEQFPLNHQMLAVFMELDGKTPLNLVAQRVGLNMGTLREVIAKLMKNGLIAKMEKDVVTVDKEFFDYLMAHLRLAITYGLMDREAEARAAAAEVRRINPGFSAESFVKMVPFKNQEDLAREIDALRRAGMK